MALRSSYIVFADEYTANHTRDFTQQQQENMAAARLLNFKLLIHCTVIIIL
jgi:hypothetical protein